MTPPVNWTENAADILRAFPAYTLESLAALELPQYRLLLAASRL